MLKKILPVTLALVLVVVFCGVASAHYCKIEQRNGDYNFAFVGQYDDFHNFTEIRQHTVPAVVNTAVVVQTTIGDACDADIRQDGSFLNFAFVEQSDTDVWGSWLTIEEKIVELAGMYYDYVVCPDPCPPVCP